MNLLYIVILATYAASVNSENEERQLLVLTVATEETDGFKRLERSLKVNELNYSVLGKGEKWQGLDMRISIGGGQKVNQLRKELEKYKEKDDLVILFVDGYDVIVTKDKKQILAAFRSFDAAIVFGAEDSCWPDNSLKSQYPKVQFGYKYLNSGGFIGLAPKIYQMVAKGIDDNEDDQLYYTKIFLDAKQREILDIKLDTQASIFQNLNFLEADVSLEFEPYETRLLNTVYHSVPMVIHGNGYSKYVLNSLGNYLAMSWVTSEGCLACSEDNLKLEEVPIFPLVLIGIFIEGPTPFLEEMLDKVANLTYPKNRIHLFIHNKVKIHEKTVLHWINKKKESEEYLSVKFISSADGVKDWHTRNLAVKKCLELSCDVYFSLDSEVHLDNPDTLKLLISYNRPVIGAIMTRINKAWSTFWGAVTKNGYYARSTDYMDIIGNKRRGIWNVPHIYGVYVIQGSVLVDQKKKPDFISNLLDADLAMTSNMRMNNVFMYAANLEYYGHLVDVDVVTSDHLHNDLWYVATNPSDWELRYLHPSYYETLDSKTSVQMPCPDVFWLPLFTERFCQELIDTVEHFGNWSSGGNEDLRLTGGYENVPTVDIHMKQVHYEQEWLYILKTYVKPMAEKVYIGYNSEARALMNFVVRYKPSEQPLLRPHHDSSTYTINVGLNRPGIDYEGGGSNFIRYNCSVRDTKVGWAIIHPGRLTHYHEGLETVRGTRYIMVSFIDP